MFSKIPTNRATAKSSTPTTTDPATKTSAPTLVSTGAKKTAITSTKVGARGSAQVEEVKTEPPKTGLFTQKPSAKLTSIKISDPFASKSKLKT